jgi:trimeric autotransporter adhesin
VGFSGRAQCSTFAYWQKLLRATEEIYECAALTPVVHSSSQMQRGLLPRFCLFPGAYWVSLRYPLPNAHEWLHHAKISFERIMPMRTRAFTSVLPALFAMFSAGPVLAQGTAFTYQGRLNDDGQSASGRYDLMFSLYGTSTGGSPLSGPITNFAVGVSNGLFTVTVDLGANFPGADRWLEIGVRTNGGGAFAILSPRQTLMATPYAIAAENLDGIVSSSSLSGTYGNAVLLTNPANQFNGNGSGLASVNAATLGGLTAGSFWRTTGNSGTVAGSEFLGTADNQPFELHVNGQRALRLEPNMGAGPNVIGGASNNSAMPGSVGGTIAGGELNTVSGPDATVGGGYANQAANSYATVGGGYDNTNSGFGATVGGGYVNTASGQDATVGGGVSNFGTGRAATVGGGAGNTGGGFLATVGGGNANTASGYAATVGGGVGNSSTVFSATVPGGYYNTASGNYSLAAGYNAQATNQGAFVWADSQGAQFYSTGNDQFLIRAQGGVGINVNNPTDAALSVAGRIRVNDNTVFLRAGTDANHGLAYCGLGINNYGTLAPDGPVLWGYSGGALGANAGSGPHAVLAWDGGSVSINGNLFVSGQVCAANVTCTSDRNLKERFAPVDSNRVLEKVAALPITEWNFKTDASARHIGPMAQDFYAAFNVGTDEKHIGPIDEGGVALAAIKGLNQKLNSESTALRNELHRTETENAELRQEISELKKLVDSLNEKVDRGAK